jgi:hypothetical protein
VDFGLTETLLKLAETSGLVGALTTAFGKNDAMRIFALAAHQACDSGASYLAGKWLEETILAGYAEGLSEASVSRFLANMGRRVEGTEQFFAAWIDACGRPQALIHDNTSISTYSERMTMAGVGYNRDKESLPQVNVALVCGRDEMLPLWYRALEGSVPDVASLQKTISLLERLKLDKPAIALDKGYYSENNLVEMRDAKMNFIIGVPMGRKKALMLVKSNADALASLDASFLRNDIRLRHVACEYAVEHSDKRVATFPAHLYLDPERRESMLHNLERKVLELEQMVSGISFPDTAAAKDWIEKKAGTCGQFLKIIAGQGKTIVVRDSAAVGAAAATYGYMLLVASDPACGRDQALSDYRSRDIAEKLFDICKNSIGGNRLRSSNDDGMNGRLFIAFIAVILHALIGRKLDQSKLKIRSIPEAFAYLAKAKALIYPDGKIFKLEIPKKTREIMACLEKPTPSEFVSPPTKGGRKTGENPTPR